MSGRYVLRYRGSGDPAPADIERIRANPAVIVVDQTPRMLLVEAEEATLREHLRTSPDWVMAPERSIEVPDTREQVRRPPSP